ncbi:MAG: hypothetical protein WBA79_15125 [Mycobacterium sp.]
MFFNGFAEFGEGEGADDAVMGGDAEGVAGVVVDEVEDFDVRAIGEAPVGEVALPAFVGLLNRSSLVGAWSLLARWSNMSLQPQNPTVSLIHQSHPRRNSPHHWRTA